MKTATGWMQLAINLEAAGLRGATLGALCLSYTTGRRTGDRATARFARAAYRRVKRGGII
jgi:hypothetical protein